MLWVKIVQSFTRLNMLNINMVPENVLGVRVCVCVGVGVGVGACVGVGVGACARARAFTRPLSCQFK